MPCALIVVGTGPGGYVCAVRAVQRRPRVDGREAVTFLVRVKEGLEDPARMVLDL